MTSQLRRKKSRFREGVAFPRRCWYCRQGLGGNVIGADPMLLEVQ